MNFRSFSPFAALFLVFFLFSPVTFAGQDSSPTAESQDLGEINKALAVRKAEQAELEKKATSIERELEDTRRRIVETAKSVQKSEKEIRDLDQRIAVLEKQDLEIRQNLESGRADTARLLLALERLRRMPPEVMIARPETPLKTAQSAILMRDILPALTGKAQILKDNLRKLQSVTSELKQEREKVLLAAKNLKKEQAELDVLAKQRKTLYANTQKDLKAQQEKVSRISAQAKSLADLVKRLDEDRRKQRVAEEEQARQAKSIWKRPGKTEKMPRAGSPNLPVSGTIITHFDEPDDFGAPSQGISIEGRPRALVTAPMGGVVRFAGKFKSYGNMVILEHEKGWHSLVAGLEKIDTVVGQSVSAGEPLGALRRSSSSGGNPVLYYELRYNGKAVNPSKKFAGLS